MNRPFESNSSQNAMNTNNVEDKGIEKLLLLDVSSISLGIGLSNGEMDIIIPRNTTIPCERTRKYKTSKDYQSKIILKVYQGERIFTKDNSFLGSFKLSPLLFRRSKEFGL